METTSSTDKGAPQTSRFQFHGEAGEFFGIWFVNNIFTMLTLGFYSPWAKIRTLQYFYGNTELAGSSFQFTANPWALLRTRVIAVLLLILYVASENLSTMLAGIVFAGFVIGYFALAPILLIFMLSFRTRYSVWRGVSFGFKRDYAGAYRVYLAPLLMLALVIGSLALPYYSEEVEQALGIPHYETTEEIMDADQAYTEQEVMPDVDPATMESDAEITDQNVQLDEEKTYFNPYLFIPFGILLLIYLILLPYFDFINMRFMVRNSRYGNGEFSFSANAKHYYDIYIKWMVATLVLAALWIANIFFEESVGVIGFVPLVMITLFYSVITRAYFKSRRTNILLAHVSLAKHHHVRGFIPFLPLLWLLVSNSIMVAITFGLMGPWAKVRVAQFMLDRIEIQSTESLDGFVEKQSQEASSLAEEVADAFDLDLV